MLETNLLFSLLFNTSCVNINIPVGLSHCKRAVLSNHFQTVTASRSHAKVILHVQPARLLCLISLSKQIRSKLASIKELVQVYDNTESLELEKK